MSKTKTTKLQRIQEILEQRGKEYGSFNDNTKFAMNFYYANAGVTLDMKNLTKLTESEINTIRYYIFMIGAKLARLNFNPKHKDSIDDLLGYTKIYKESCDFRFTFKATSGMQQGLIDMINHELNKEDTQEIANENPKTKTRQKTNHVFSM